MNQIFINLPVSDLGISRRFYEAIGFKNVELFTGENQVSMAWNENILVMLQTKAFFGSGTNKIIAPTESTLSSSFTLPLENIERVNTLVEKGLLAGGKEPNQMQDLGFMHIRNVEDPDGHLWAFISLDIDAFKQLKESTR